MLPKTENGSADRAMPHFVRDAGLAGLAVLIAASATAADDALKPGQRTRATGDRALFSVTQDSEGEISPSASATRIPVQWSSWTRVLPAAETVDSDSPEFEPAPAPSPVSEPDLQDEQYTALEAAAETKSQISQQPSQRYYQVRPSDSGFGSRIEYVMSGGLVDSSVETVGDWWEHRADQMLNHLESNKKSSQHQAAQGSPAESQAAASAHGAEFFESRPIAVAAKPTPQASATKPLIRQTAATDEADPDYSPAPVSRLRRDIRSIKPTLNYALKNIPKGQLPDDFDTQIDQGEYQTRQSSPIVYQWASTDFYHYPIYFEDPALERYGHTYHPIVQPFASTGRFATQLVGLPYQMALHPICSKRYSLGYYRPGEVAPKKYPQIPFNEEATITEAATLIGLFFLIP